MVTFCFLVLSDLGLAPWVCMNLFREAILVFDGHVEIISSVEEALESVF